MSAQPKSSQGYSILDAVNDRFKLPFQPYDFQREDIEALGHYDRIGLYLEPGCGKTLVSTVIALHQQIIEPQRQCYVLMPPILINSWARWLRSIGGVAGDDILVYRGTPKQRAGMDLSRPKFLLMSMQIFKQDQERLQRAAGERPRCAIVDEATSIKNVGSDNHRSVRDFFNGHPVLLLTGTPLSNPGDVYAYVKLVAPIVYRSFQQFRNIHVGETDFFGNVTEWRNLELLQQNLMINSTRRLKEDVLKDLKQPVYVPIRFQLEPAHQKLYERVMQEQLIEYASGKIIDATSAARLYNAAQQIVCNYGHFADDLSKRSVALDLVTETIEELGIKPNGSKEVSSGKKLIVFAQYKMTNRALHQMLEPYGAAACYSEIPRAQQDKGIDRFMTDPSCKILVAQPLSAGFGLNLQEVCSEVLFLETPTTPSHFHQATARVYREGQRNTPVVRIAIAERTIQTLLHRRLLEKDELVNKIQIGFQDLKDAIYGDE